jgi:hypothetical protein
MSADALLLIIESQTDRLTSLSFAGSMPSKIFEYLYAGKPILAIVPPGPERRLLERHRSVYLAEPNDPPSVTRALLEMLAQPWVRGGTVAVTRGDLQAFDRRALTRQLSSVLSQAGAQPSATRTRE